jgi:hypothetical protein
MDYESNPGLYLQLSQPKPSLDQLNADMDGFMKAVKEARVKFAIADLVIIAECLALGVDGQVGQFFTWANCGAFERTPLMLARALGEVQQKTKTILAQAIARAGKEGRK